MPRGGRGSGARPRPGFGGPGEPASQCAPTRPAQGAVVHEASPAFSARTPGPALSSPSLALWVVSGSCCINNTAINIFSARLNLNLVFELKAAGLTSGPFIPF